jgi:mannosyltransferase OCH1-like enzyme
MDIFNIRLDISPRITSFLEFILNKERVIYIHGEENSNLWFKNKINIYSHKPSVLRNYPYYILNFWDTATTNHSELILQILTLAKIYESTQQNIQSVLISNSCLTHQYVESMLGDTRLLFQQYNCLMNILAQPAVPQPTVPQQLVHFIFEPVYYASMPPQWQQTILRFQELHPTYTVKVWNKSDIRDLLSKTPQYLNTYDSLDDEISKLDYARYVILYNYGGYYFDLDVTFTNPLIDFNADIILVKESNYSIEGQVGNFMIYVRHPQSMFMKQCLDNCKKLIKPFDNYIQRILQTAGPHFLTVQLLIYISTQRGVDLQNWSQEDIFRDDEHHLIILPQIYSKDIDVLNRLKSFSHHYESSWISDNSYSTFYYN